MTDETPRRGERTREDILQAALALFLERGYHGTSMRQIAEQAGVALGGIYNHFASKEEIFLEVLTANHPIYDVLPAMEAAQGETVEEIVRDAASRMVARFDQRMEFMNLVFIELVEFEGRHLPDLFAAFFPQAFGFVQRALGGRDELRPIPLPIVLRAFIGLFFSYMITEMMLGKQMMPELRENALEHFVDIFLHGILNEKAGGELQVAQGEIASPGRTPGSQ